MKREIKLLIAVKLLFWAFRVLPKDSTAKISLAMYLKERIMKDYN
jgi:hypothetical protein